MLGRRRVTIRQSEGEVSRSGELDGIASENGSLIVADGSLNVTRLIGSIGYGHSRAESAGIIERESVGRGALSLQRDRGLLSRRVVSEDDEAADISIGE